MKENIPAGAEAPNATSDPSTAVPCPEPRMTDGPANSVLCRLNGATRFGTVPTDFIYTRHDPFAVAVAFHQGEGRTTEWSFARDLLVQALATDDAAGIGDIAIARSGAAVTLTLNPATPNEFKFTYERVQIAAFLSATTRLVMIGAETYNDLDAEIAELLT